MKELKVSSTAFKPGEWIPKDYSGHGKDKSPELIIENMDQNAVSMAVTLDDLGHPIFPGYNHWVAWNIPPVSRIPENLPKGACLDEPLHIEQGLAYGKHCYHGPKPPLNWNHDYLFTVYVLDIKLEVSHDSDKETVLKAMAGHIIQEGTLIGKYQRKHT